MNDRSTEIACLIQALSGLARTDTYSSFNVSAGKGYTRQAAKITPDVIRAHLNGDQPIAVFPVLGEKTRIAVLDVDNHNGQLSWNDVAEAMFPVLTALVGAGYRPLAFRSGGGAGIHIWLIWKEQQSASDVRTFLRKTLSRCGFRAGTEGLDKDAIEIYPKQDRVAGKGFGNPIALPLARQSIPLDHSLQPIPIDKFHTPDIEQLFSPNVPVSRQGCNDGAGAPNANDPSTLNEVLSGDLEEVQAALKHISSGDYDVWICIGLVLKSCFGEEGFDLWDQWSATSGEKYPGTDSCRKVWDGLRPDGRVGLGSLFHSAQKNGWNGPSDPVIREMNARFGILTHKNKTLIILKNADRDKNDVLDWLTKPTFEDRIAAETIQIPVANGEVKRAPKSRIWLNHPRASHYHRIDFDPSKPPGQHGKIWNIWQGFGVDAVPGEWNLLRDHIYRNICAGDAKLYDWLMNWMALGVQQPGLVIGTAPVLLGFPGTGKGFLANAYGRLWGPHHTTITNQAHVSGRFNSHLFGKRFVFIDEGTFGGNRREAGVIKTRTTEPMIILEAKGVDPIEIPNRMIFMIASNEDSVVPADKADRRWQVFDVGDGNREDHEFFGAIMRQLENGGYEAMLYDLQHRDISKGPDPRKIIKTDALFEQIFRAQSSETRYLHQILDDGLLPQQDAPGNGPGSTTIRALYKDLRATQGNSHYVTVNGLGRFLNKVIPGIRTMQNGTHVVRYDLVRGNHETERSTRYVFPPLADCRREFEKYIGQPVPWTNNLSEWQCEPH